MAVLENIRKRGGLIISIVIGLALFAFIMSDFVPGGRGRVTNSDVAEISGETLSVQLLEARIEEETFLYMQETRQSNVDERQRDAIHEQAWQNIVNETIARQEYEKIGLTVSPEELWDVITGINPHVYIRQNFTNPQTGEFDRAALMNFLRLKDTNTNYAQEWNMLEKRILDACYMQKYSNLVSKGIFVPDFMAENENREAGKAVDFDYVVQGYASVPDSTITVSDDDIRDYYDKHKKQWIQTASRDIEYVVFNIVPSGEDRTAAQEWIEKNKPEFEQASDPFQFVRLNSRMPADTRFLTREQLPVQVTDIFDMPVGHVAGPYQEGEALKLVRLTKVEARPDSVKARQIVVMPKLQTQESYTEAIALADSIRTAILGGADFTQLAVKYSADPSAATTNGDMGWIQESAVIGSMMENLFNMNAGEVSAIQTGQAIFVVHVTERGREVKKVQIATLQHDILPSSRTGQAVYSQASKFAADNRSEEQFDKTTAAAAAATQTLDKRVASYIGENDRQIPGLLSARQIVRWAFEAKRGDVSDVFSLGNSYVVAVLKNIRKDGVTPINEVAAEINLTLRHEKKAAKIATQLSEAAQNVQSLSELAVDLNLPVETAAGITFSAFNVPGIGIETGLIGAVANTDEGVISKPVEGLNGVYLFTVKQTTAPEETGVETARERLTLTYASRSVSEPLQALRRAAKIDDMRSKFY